MTIPHGVTRPRNMDRRGPRALERSFAIAEQSRFTFRGVLINPLL
jgi:hypothetical protein